MRLPGGWGCDVALVATKRGLVKALHSGEAAYKAFPAYRDQRLEPVLRGLLDTAMNAGKVRTDVAPLELLDAVSKRCMTARPGEGVRAERMVGILLDGLCYRAEAARRPSPSASDRP